MLSIVANSQCSIIPIVELSMKLHGIENLNFKLELHEYIMHKTLFSFFCANTCITFSCDFQVQVQGEFYFYSNKKSCVATLVIYSLCHRECINKLANFHALFPLRNFSIFHGLYAQIEKCIMAMCN